MQKPNLLALSAVCLSVFVLAGCSNTPKEKVVVIRPAAVIEADVYVREPSASYEQLTLGGAALRQPGFEHTLNNDPYLDSSKAPVQPVAQPVRTATAKKVVKRIKKSAPKKVKTASTNKAKKKVVRRKTAPVMTCDQFSSKYSDCIEKAIEKRLSEIQPLVIRETVTVETKE